MLCLKFHNFLHTELADNCYFRFLVFLFSFGLKKKIFVHFTCYKKESNATCDLGPIWDFFVPA